MWPRHQRKETSYALDFSYKITERIFNIIGEHFEENVLLAMANRIDCKSETIKYLLGDRVSIQIEALSIALPSAVKET